MEILRHICVICLSNARNVTQVDNLQTCRCISGRRLKPKNRMLSQASKSTVGVHLANSWT